MVFDDSSKKDLIDDGNEESPGPKNNENTMMDESRIDFDEPNTPNNGFGRESSAALD
jgi:hypothetical protein